ncbi:YndM family protein [Tenuibacillus multivorans]|uniref:Uncharacterized protein n=1 Tax=Tenuibacillus multivorans TaxID=237069 RepID=A0A1H0CMU8_9BACI|nr:YndM family protein [Tenuibacillus multivorans]GEL76234.1 putative membrane protein YndM [Tenuibacillus multivorans]SDN59219.1 Protein of unknown function [Tenuibacillus multivorans]
MDLNHFKLLSVKFLVTLVLLYLILGFGYDVAFSNVLMISLAVTLIGYLGDVFILPRTNNTVATVTDFILAYVVVYFMTDMLTVGGDVFTASLISAIGITICEWFYHKYVQNEFKDSGYKEDDRANDYTLQTEFSEEIEPNYQNQNPEDREK